jgi:adenosylcobinamide-phosphate synthase
MAVALLIDLTLGDPSNRCHPVAWMGRLIAAAQRRAPRAGRLGPWAYGALLAAGGAAAAAALARLLASMTARLPLPWNTLADAALLKMMLSVRGLATAAGGVRDALEAGDLAEARRLLGWHLVSRATSTLSPAQVAAATIESVAENTSDGIVGPLLYYAVGGLPAAAAYRFINTADAMLGYRDGCREWLGKVPARLDDLLNLVPARLTAAIFVLTAPAGGGHPRRAWQVWRRDASRTASPNAGHPMSAMAGALGVEMEKVACYRLGEGQRLPIPEDISRAVRLMRMTAALALGALTALLIGMRRNA